MLLDVLKDSIYQQSDYFSVFLSQSINFTEYSDALCIGMELICICSAIIASFLSFKTEIKNQFLDSFIFINHFQLKQQSFSAKINVEKR